MEGSINHNNKQNTSKIQGSPGRGVNYQQPSPNQMLFNPIVPQMMTSTNTFRQQQQNNQQQMPFQAGMSIPMTKANFALNDNKYSTNVAGGQKKKGQNSGYNAIITGANQTQLKWPGGGNQGNHNYGFSQALLGHVIQNIPSSQRPQQLQQVQPSVSPLQFYQSPYQEMQGMMSNNVNLMTQKVQNAFSQAPPPYHHLLPYDQNTGTSRQANKSNVIVSQRRSGTVQNGKEGRTMRDQESAFKTISAHDQGPVNLNLSQFGMNPSPIGGNSLIGNIHQTIAYGGSAVPKKQRRDMSNPRGFITQQKIRGNLDIKETVEAHLNRKGRSKSRRQGTSNGTTGPHFYHKNNSLLNTKTIEEYSSGMIDPTYHRAPNNSMLNDFQSQQPNLLISQYQGAAPSSVLLPDHQSHANLQTLDPKPKKPFGGSISVSRKKDRPTTSTNLVSYALNNINPQIATLSSNMPSTLDDYLPPKAYPVNISSNNIGKTDNKNDSELERLINEKLNQRYQQPKRRQEEMATNTSSLFRDINQRQQKSQNRAVSVPRGGVGPQYLGLPSGSHNYVTNQGKVKNVYGALNESGASSMVNQQMHSNVSLYPVSQPTALNASILNKNCVQNGVKGGNASNIILPQNNNSNKINLLNNQMQSHEISKSVMMMKRNQNKTGTGTSMTNRKQLIATTQNPFVGASTQIKGPLKTRNVDQNTDSSNNPPSINQPYHSYNNDLSVNEALKQPYLQVKENLQLGNPTNRYQMQNFEETVLDNGHGHIGQSQEEIKSHQTQGFIHGFNDTSVYSNLGKVEPQVIDSFALDQSPNVVNHQQQQFYPAAVSYVLKDRHLDNSLAHGLQNQQHFKSVSKRNILSNEKQAMGVGAQINEFDNDSYGSDQIVGNFYAQTNHRSISPDRNYIKVTDNNKDSIDSNLDISGFNDQNITKQKRSQSTLRTKGGIGMSKGAALIQALGSTNNTLKNHQTERGGGRPIVKKAAGGNRAQSQLRSLVRPTTNMLAQKPALVNTSNAGKSNCVGSEYTRDDYNDRGGQNKNNFHYGSVLVNQTSNESQTLQQQAQPMASHQLQKPNAPRNMRIRETPIRVRKGNLTKVIQGKSSSNDNTQPIIDDLLNNKNQISSLGNDETSAEIKGEMARSDEQILHKKQFQFKRKEAGVIESGVDLSVAPQKAEESFVLFQKGNVTSNNLGNVGIASSQFIRGRRYTISNNNQGKDQSEGSQCSGAPLQQQINNNIREFAPSVDQDDYFDPQTTSSMMYSINKAQAQFKKQFQNTGSLGVTKVNRQNLSKSIILHHNKLNSLLSTGIGRYNEILMKQDDDDDENNNIDENDEELQYTDGSNNNLDRKQQKQYGDDEDDGCVRNALNDTVDSRQPNLPNSNNNQVVKDIKIVNASAAPIVGGRAAAVNQTYNKQVAKQVGGSRPFEHHFASQVSGQTYDTVFHHHGVGNAHLSGGANVNSAQKDFSNMLNITANKSSMLLGGDDQFSSSFDPPNPLAHQKKSNISGSNALLSLLSQDDFTKLKQDIHHHIEKFGGQIEEKAASEEEEESGRSLTRNYASAEPQKPPQRNRRGREIIEMSHHTHMSSCDKDDGQDDNLYLLLQENSQENGGKKLRKASGSPDDDDDVVLKSFRDKKGSGVAAAMISSKRGDLKTDNSVTQIEGFDSYDNQIEDSPRQNTKYMKTPSITEKP